jgi:hypothetical protein
MEFAGSKSGSAGREKGEGSREQGERRREKEDRRDENGQPGMLSISGTGAWRDR